MPPTGKKGKGPGGKSTAGKTKGNGKNSPDKCAQKKEIEEPEKTKTHNKLTSTWGDFSPFYFNKYRCNECKIVFESFIQFIAHSCCRKHFAAKFDMSDTQTYVCRNCHRLYMTEADYGSHQCSRMEPEDALPVRLQDHLDFYKMWRRRVARETEPHAPDTSYLVRCGTCGRRYKSKLSFLIHSCVAVHGLGLSNLANLTTCRHCRLVFGAQQQFQEHVGRVCDAERAFPDTFQTSRLDRACQQFILMRHGAEEQFQDEAPLKNCPNICFDCGYEYPSVLDYLQHPCAAGRLVTPFDLELTLLCRQCHRLFTSVDRCAFHLRSCSTSGFYFLRFSSREIGVALERFSEDDLADVHQEKRPRKFLCRHCHEIFRDLMPFLRHSCPTESGRRRLFLQPASLTEMYVCADCFLVCLSALDSQAHAERCPQSEKPRMVWLHLTKAEYLAALEPWCRKPRVLELPMSLSTQLESHVSSV